MLHYKLHLAPQCTKQNSDTKTVFLHLSINKQICTYLVLKLKKRYQQTQ